MINLTWTIPESGHLTGFDILRNNELLENVAPTTNFYSVNTANLQDGNYKYCVVPVYPFECDLGDECFYSTVGINIYSSTIRLYPNPAKNELRITNYELRNGSLSEVEVEIFDVYGRKLKGERRTEKGERTMVIDISNLNSGVYFVKFTDEQNFYIQRFIKY
jgi:hypothetical protein